MPGHSRIAPGVSQHDAPERYALKISRKSSTLVLLDPLNSTTPPEPDKTLPCISDQACRKSGAAVTSIHGP